MSLTTVLHVEDDPNDLLLFQHACRKGGVTARVLSVTNGGEAVAYLNREGQYADREAFPSPDLILLDLKMPRLSGFEVLEFVRREPRFCLTPVVVISSSNHDVDVRKAYELGANSVVVKPVAFDDLVKIVVEIQRYWLELNQRIET